MDRICRGNPRKLNSETWDTERAPVAQLFSYSFLSAFHCFVNSRYSSWDVHRRQYDLKSSDASSFSLRFPSTSSPDHFFSSLPSDPYFLRSVSVLIKGGDTLEEKRTYHCGSFGKFKHALTSRPCGWRIASRESCPSG